MQVGVKSMHGLVKTKIVYILPDVPFVQSLSIRKVGISDVSQHSKAAVNVKNEKQVRSQCTFKTNAGSLTGCSKPTTNDQILKAEILQALNMGDKNDSFSFPLTRVYSAFTDILQRLKPQQLFGLFKNLSLREEALKKLKSPKNC